jgi:hypothetical protein
MKGIDLMNSDPTHWVSAIALVQRNIDFGHT